MVKKSSLNVTMLLFSLLAAAFVFVLGEAVLWFMSDLPFIVQTAIYLTFVTCFVFLAIFLSEKVSTGYYIPRGRVTFNRTAAKAAAILVPIALVLGLVTQLIYGFLGAADEVVDVEDFGIAFRSHYVFESSRMQGFLLEGRGCSHSAYVSNNPISTVQEHYEFVGVVEGGIAHRSFHVFESQQMHDLLLVTRVTARTAPPGLVSDSPIITGAESLTNTWVAGGTLLDGLVLEGFDLGFFMEAFYAKTYAGIGHPDFFDQFVQGMYNPDFTINDDYVDVFLSVLRGGFNDGFASIYLPTPIVAITADAMIYDGRDVPLDAGKIDIIFQVHTYTDDHLYFTGFSCTPGPDFINSFGHGFLHEGFDNMRLGDNRQYEPAEPHLLQVNLRQEAEEDTFAMTASIPAFDLGFHMQNYYEDAYAGGAFPDTFDEFVAGMFGPGASVSLENTEVFLSVLQNGFNRGFSSVSLPSPITAISAEAVLFDGWGYVSDAGKIDLHFSITTNDGSKWAFLSVSCGGNTGLFALDTYGHGFVQDGFEKRLFGYRNIYEAYRPHLLLVPGEPNADSALRIAIQSLMLALWGAFIGLAVVLFLNNSKLFGSFFIPKVIVSILVSAAFSVMMAHLDVDINMTARGLFAVGMCLLYLPTFSWGDVDTSSSGEFGAFVPKR